MLKRILKFLLRGGITIDLRRLFEKGLRMNGKYEMTRGEKNDNPLNIRESATDRTQWQGERPTDDDTAFEEFKTPTFGIRAGALILCKYQEDYRLLTVQDIIAKWAPPTDNNPTRTYIEFVAKKMDVMVDQEIDILKNPELFCKLIMAMITFENGRCIYDPTIIMEGIDLALQRIQE